MLYGEKKRQIKWKVFKDRNQLYMHYKKKDGNQLYMHFPIYKQVLKLI